MKAYLFIETGEVRPPKDGEYYVLGKNMVIHSGQNYSPDSPILTRHEIEVPEGATFFQYQIGGNGFSWSNGTMGYIPIPRPKKKVKKWRWYMDDWAHPGGVHVSPSHHTEEDAKRIYEAHKFLCKIPETEIEVEVPE